jgi:uncharacterized SAM-binding protein YcdF (DUF218 family)
VLRSRIRIAASLTVLLAGVVLAGWPVYVAPRTDALPTSTPADAVVALGGMPESGLVAQKIFTSGRARQLVLSNAYAFQTNAVTTLCDTVATGTSHHAAVGTSPATGLTCFFPEPTTTRGEAEEIRRLAAARGWHRIVVVAPTFHISRARQIVSRCFAGDLLMYPVAPPLSPLAWAYEYAYQTAAFVKAWFTPGC